MMLTTQMAYIYCPMVIRKDMRTKLEEFDLNISDFLYLKKEAHVGEGPLAALAPFRVRKIMDG